LLTLPGIAPWTADYVVMRVLRAPDVLLADDVAGLTERAQAWRPGMYLWRAGAAGNKEHQR
jgi:AraC family transcriptional regulator of adaptative response / DNA-3-methyladenine glycosylase II